MSSVSKGSRLELEMTKLLRSEGFDAHKTTRTRFSANDFWGCFDIMAKHVADPDYTFYFQVSTRWKSGKDLDEIESFLKGAYDVVVLVRRADYSPFQYKIYSNGVWSSTDLAHIKAIASQ